MAQDADVQNARTPYHAPINIRPQLPLSTLAYPTPLYSSCRSQAIFSPEILFPPLPLHRPLHIHNIPQLASQFHDPTAYHAWIDRYCLLYEFLSGGRGVEAYDEVVAAAIAGLISLNGSGEEEGAPVRYAADYATLGEDEGAGCAGESGANNVSLRIGIFVEQRREKRELSEWDGQAVLFDFVRLMRLAHADLDIVNIKLVV